MTWLQQMSHCLLVDMGEYLSVYLDKEWVGKLAERLCGFRGAHSTPLHEMGAGSLTLHELIDRVGLGDVLYAPGKQVVGIDDVQGPGKFDGELVGELVFAFILARHRGAPVTFRHTRVGNQWTTGWMSSTIALYVTYPTPSLNLHPSSPWLPDVGHLLTHTSVSVVPPLTHPQSPRPVDSGHFQEELQV